MKRAMLVELAMTLAVAVPGSAQPTTSEIPHYSRAEIKQMMQGAHTPEQYQALAAYFRARQRDFKAQAKSEMAEWEYRIQFVTGPAAKYPRPVDSSRNRYEYFRYEADQMARKAAHFESLSASSSQRGVE